MHAPAYSPSLPEKPHNRPVIGSYHDDEDESDEERDKKPGRSGLTESQEILLMLQQEEALAYVDLLAGFYITYK